MVNPKTKPRLTNLTQTLTPQCKVVVYNWSSQVLSPSGGDNATLAATTSLDISSQIKSCQFTKSMGNASGSFSFTLTNSPGVGNEDWKDLIKRGSWCVIYMSQDGSLSLAPSVSPAPSLPKEAPYVRCIGFIDRVEVQASLNEAGAFDIGYTISGRDFGVIYEDANIWLNTFQLDNIELKSLRARGLSVLLAPPLHEALKLLHGLIFNPASVTGANVNKQGSLTSIALQWLLPRQMLRDLGLKVDSTPFWGELTATLNFESTGATLTSTNPLDFLFGAAWENLKRASEPTFHELYTETNSVGIPQLNFRPMPFAIDKSKYPTLGKFIKLYRDVPSFELKSTFILDFSMGEDNHGRYNSFLTQVVTEQVNINANQSALRNSRFPFNNQASIKRYGFRNMHVQINAITRTKAKNGDLVDLLLLREYNEVLLDYYNNLVFAESGEIQCLGQNAIKVGKCVVPDVNTPYLYGRRYYVEGYTDIFSVAGNGAGTWVQTLMVTHGYEESDLRGETSFGTRSVPFANPGEYTPGNGSKK